MIDTRIIKIEIVPATYNPKAFELRIWHGDGTWMYFSRGFGTREDALAVAKKLTKGPIHG
jgi:hypothetical protein